LQAEFLGNRALREQLGRLGEEGRLHHCLLFEGIEGVGKATTARWLSRLINCEAEQGLRPCASCWTCKMIPEGNHPDVIELGIDPEKTTQIISVRQARDLIGQLTVRPHSARHRIIIIDPADALTTEAANALLKTLEEPPSETRFILVSARPATVLATVRSRSQRIRFSPVADAEIEKWLIGQGKTLFEGLLQGAGGGPGRALTLSQEGEETILRARSGFLGALSGSMDDLLAYGERLTKGSRVQWSPRVEEVMKSAESLVHDLVLLVSKGDQAVLSNASEIGRLRAWAAVLGYPGIRNLMAAIASARSDLGANLNGRLVMDTLLSRWARELGKARKA
jgi:DNA polymerase-3 subunit delta'